MKTWTVVMAVTAIIILMAGCHAHQEQDESASKTIQREISPVSAKTAESLQDTARKFIRTSDLKFRVKDVAQATYQIEDITRNAHGFVTYTHLESTTEEKKVTRLSLDSALETVHYTVSNNMTIRVPNEKLDSTLKAIASLVDYLDYRTIKADDVALQIKSNQKALIRASGNSQRVRSAIDTRGKKLHETTEAESLASNNQKEADEAELANLALADQVNFSTLSLSLYQRTEIKQWLIPNDNTDQCRQGFGLRIW